MWKSPNGTIRAILDGTVFREPIIVKGIDPFVRTWKRPIVIARHAYGDVYKNVEMSVTGPGKAELVCTDKSGKETRMTIHDFDDDGIIMGMHNTQNPLRALPEPVSTMLSTEKWICGSRPRIQFQRHMTTGSRIFSRTFMRPNTGTSSKKQVSHISTHL